MEQGDCYAEKYAPPNSYFLLGIFLYKPTDKEIIGQLVRLRPVWSTFAPKTRVFLQCPSFTHETEQPCRSLINLAIHLAR